MEQATFRELIVRNVDAKDAEDAIRQVGQRFLDAGFVKDTYIDAVAAREAVYPTGLQLAEIAVAMPHTDPQHVNRPGVCIAQLAHPVTFAHMGEPEVKVEAEMLFMMAIQNPDEQVELLQKVLSVFQQPEVVAAFRAADSEEKLFEAAQKYIG
ncbi:PTS sugar transporter subunit IIA [Agathobaculum sp.]|uniref:PTS sugar transporter subunit IIA n=1 Tax=Agathobaculum sp. TaxID=2048138 RepID=UPI002A80C0BF|nr:PTS sugar transporter subunit IIA [Agathobaculum sp.]MDY3619174.1 PTS sugar transporter subunit IIA [Agathobaculum sp.]